MAEFLDESADRSQSHIYKLHGVLVHSGNLHGGQYFALIKPDRETRWLKFDDDRVTPVTDKEVLDDNYGDEIMNEALSQGQRRNRAQNAEERFTNAYVLVYIRDSAIDEVLAPLSEEDTPSHLSKIVTVVIHDLQVLTRRVSYQNDVWRRSALVGKPNSAIGMSYNYHSLRK